MANQAVNLAALICQRRKNNESDASSQALIDVQHKIPPKKDSPVGDISRDRRGAGTAITEWRKKLDISRVMG